jgi:hypothetical protein
MLATCCDGLAAQRPISSLVREQSTHAKITHGVGSGRAALGGSGACALLA